MYSLVAKRMISQMAIAINCNGVAESTTAPNEMNAAAEAKSAFNKLDANNGRVPF